MLLNFSIRQFLERYSKRFSSSGQRIAAFVLAAFSLLSLGIIEANAQDRRIVTIDDADYFGSDYQTVKDVDIDGCKDACLADGKCQAFTFNTSAGWCFLKSEFGQLQSFVGAVAGRVVEVQAKRPDATEDRKAELGFVSRAALEQAETYSKSIRNSVRSTGLTVDQNRRNGLQALGSRNGALAEADFLQLLLDVPGDFEAWTHLTTALLIQDPDNWQEKENKRQDAVSTSINAYLRSITEAERALALEFLGRALEARSEYKPAIKALRASLALEENSSIRRRYDELVAEHGFRIVDHQVDSDSLSPRVCVVFSQKLPVGEEFDQYVSVRGEGALAIESEGNQICADGLKHGTRYQLAVRSGLPAADGEKLEKSADLSIYVRDRSPSVHFLGRSYVLPAGEDPTIPIVSVNTTEVEAAVYRIGDRSIASVLRDNRFLRQLGDYQAGQIEEDLGEKVWSGVIETENTLNQDMTTAIPLADTGMEMKPGIYAMTARSKLDQKNRWGPLATQWFLVSDLGLTALTGQKGLAANVRSLSTAQAIPDVTVRLLAVNNEVLGEVRSNEEGFAEFSPGLIRGRGGNAPGILVAETDEGDYSFLDLRKPAFDLSDRGVEGRPAPGPLDVFAWTDRGIYKAGETVHAQALIRTSKALAQEGLPLTFIFTRPDGVEHARYTVQDGGLGGHLHDLELSGTAQQGIWSWQVFVDPEGIALARQTFLVEDYQPERVDFDLETAAKSFSRLEATNVSLTAKFLYGSPANGQRLEGEVIVRPTRRTEAYPGYQFGIEDNEVYADRETLPGGLKTDENGELAFDVSLPDLPETTNLYQGELVARLVETGGRYVERHLDLPVALDGPRIGIRPEFDDGVEEGGPAGFSIIVIDEDSERVSADGLSWTLSRIDRRYQWYRLDGRWSYEPITSARRVASGNLDIKDEDEGSLSLPVDWGEYRLDVQGSGSIQTASSVTFHAGWYTANSASDTPDYLEVGLDKARYRIGETAKLRLKPQMSGIAVVNVVSGGLVSSQSVEVSGEETEVSIPVTDEWGAGAYITASLYRPMDLATKRMPSRAIGLSWLQVDPQDRSLDVEITAPDRILPETELDVPVRLANLKPGEDAYLTVAAVDVGILNLTGYETPDPADWYFGQRRLGSDIRDLYGQLIDRMAGSRGRVRTGGDAMGDGLQAPPPDEEPVALFSGFVKVGENGEATVTFDVPAFNGALRLMAVAWSAEGVGHGEKDIEVRSPVVITASAPSFLAPGDRSRLLLEIDNVDGPGGDYTLDVTASNGVTIEDDAAASSRTISLERGGKHQVILPLTAGDLPETSEIVAAMTAPDGQVFVNRFTLDVRNTQPDVVRRSVFDLAAGDSLTLDTNVLEGLRPETARITLAAGGAANIDIAGLLAALDRYPYGCTEQTTSRALPLLYLSDVAEAAGLGGNDAIRKRVVEAIAGVLANQSSTGAFGLWNSYNSNNLWLDAYVTDFLTRAREKGYIVTDQAFLSALDNLENRLAYSPDFQSGGEDIAYALYVLARNGRASMGDLRYYLDAKLNSFTTPLAKAQVAAGLALYGENERAKTGFQAALNSLSKRIVPDYRNDFGSTLRDGAGVASYVIATSTDQSLTDQATGVLRNNRKSVQQSSTQEMAWMLLAADALNASAEVAELSVDGVAVPGRLAWSLNGSDLARAVDVKNNGSGPTSLMVSVSGQPTIPEPAGGRDYSVERMLYDLDGNPLDPTAVPVNTRIAVVVTVRALSDQPGRLMVVDRIPAGLTIDNPRLVRSGDLGGLSFLSMISQTEHISFYADRFEVAIDETRQNGKELTFAYLARASTPGDFAHPPASVEDMYQPDRRAVTDTERFVVLGPTR